MKYGSEVTIPEDEFIRGIEKFDENEKRETVYKNVVYLVDLHWSPAPQDVDVLGVANALQSLLLTWNQRFYRYGSFDLNDLIYCIAENVQSIASFRNREIFSLSDSDQEEIEALFDDFLEALSVEHKDKGIQHSPVSAAKALHLLAPKFFPMWDSDIAQAYGHSYKSNPAEVYFSFCKLIKGIAEGVKDYRIGSDKTIVKLIDEYNYSKYTKGWI